MADRYWVGGSGTWDDTSTANWSETSGGPGGASAPTSLDDVYFDSGSDTGANFTVTLGTGAVCKNFNVGSNSNLDRIMTLAGSSLSVYGSLLFPVSNLTCTYTGNIQFLSNALGNTITTNGIRVQGIVINSSTGGWTLGSSLLGDTDLRIDSCLLFDTAGYNIAVRSVGTTGTSGTRNIYLRSSTISDNGFFAQIWSGGSGTVVYAETSTIIAGNGFVANDNSTWNNLTIRALNLTGNITGNNLTFNVLRFNNIASTSTWSGAITCNDLILSSDVVGAKSIFLSNNVVVNNSITAGSSSANNRWLISSTSIITTRTISANTVNLQNINFRNIVASGSTPWTGVNLGDCGNNSGITFSSPKTVYWNLSGNQNWNSNGWALTSGGIPSVDNFPLPQDTCIFDDAGAAATVTLNGDYHIGTIDCTARSLPVTINSGDRNTFLYGDILLSSSTIMSGSTTVGRWFFRKIGVQSLRTAGYQFNKGFVLDNGGSGTLRLLDNLTFSTSAYFGFVLTSGTLDLNNFVLTSINQSGLVSTDTSRNRAIQFGTGKLVLSGAGIRSINLSLSGSKLIELENFSGTLIVSSGFTGIDITFNILVKSVAAGLSFLQLDDNISVDNFEIMPGVSIPLRLGQVGSYFYGNVTIPASVPEIQQYNLGASGIPGGFIFRGSNNQTLTVNGQTVQGWIDSQKSGGTLTIANDTAVNGGTILTSGTINLNGKKLTATSFRSNFTSARTLAMNGGTLELTGSGATVFNAATSTNLTVQGPGIINLTSASAKTFVGGGANYSGVTLVHGGAGDLTITGNNTFSSIRNIISQTAGSSIIFASGSTTTITGKTGLSGTSSAPLYLASSSTGTYTINNSGTSIQQADYLSVNNSIVTPSDNWYAGTRSTVTNSTGWSNTFSSAADLFWVGGNGTWDSSTNTNWAVVSGGTGGTIAPASINDVYFDSNSSSAPFTVTIDSVFEGSGTVTSGYVLNVSAVVKGTIGVGNTVFINTSVNTGINGTGASLFVNITSTDTGTGGIGTYNTNAIANHGNLSKIFVGYASARSVNFSTSQAITLAGIAPLVCNGSFTNIATNFTNNWQGDIIFTGSGTHSINTGGRYLTKRAVIVNAPLGSYTLASAFASGGASDGFSLAIGFYLFGGTFDTAGYSMYVGRLVARPTYNASLFLRNSEINLYYGWQIILFTNSGEFLTLDSGTSKISVGGGNASLILGNNNSFYTIELLPSSTTVPLNILGNNASINTFLIKRNTVRLEENLSIGQLTILGDSNFPAKISAPQKTLSANSVNLSNVIFSGIMASGPAIPWSGLNIGDANNNTNITFSSPRTLYWNLAGSQNWNSNGWALTSGGTPSVDNFPLPQDTCIFDDAGAAGTITLNVDDIGSIDFSQRTTAVTVTSGSNNISFYKNVILSSTVTITGTGTWNFLGTAIQEIISSGRTIAPAINVSGAGIKLVDAFSTSGNFTLTQGSLDLNEKTLTCGGATFNLVTNGTLTRSINFGTNGFIYLTRQAASFAGVNISNFTATDTGGGLVFMNGGTHVVYGSNTSTDRSMAINVRVAPSSRSFDFQWQPSIVKNVTFDEGYTGIVNFRGCRVLGNLVFSPNMTVAATDTLSGILFQGETQTLKTNGVAVGCPIRIGFGWLGGTVSGIFPNLTILDDLSIVRSIDTAFGASLFTLERGTLNLNGKKLTISANSFKPGFESNVTTTRNLIFGGGSIEVQGNISPWTVNATNFSVQGTGIISLTSSSAKTFAGGSANYSGVILNQGGSGELTITGNNQFGGVSNTVRPASIKFAAGSTTTLGKFMLNGSDGAPVTISSTTTGTRYTLTSSAGVFAPYYTSIRDSNATGGAVWRAPVNYGNVNTGNNLGWDFSDINTLVDNFNFLFNGIIRI